MSLLMDALRRAEAEKRAAAAREAPTLEEALPEHFDLRLEPEPEQVSTRESLARRPRAHELERVLDMGSDDPTLVDEFMLDSPLAPPAPDQATLGRPERVTPQTVFAAGRQPLMSPQTLGLAAAAVLGVASLGVLSWRVLDDANSPTAVSVSSPPGPPITGLNANPKPAPPFGTTDAHSTPAAEASLPAALPAMPAALVDAASPATPIVVSPPALASAAPPPAAPTAVSTDAAPVSTAAIPDRTPPETATPRENVDASETAGSIVIARAPASASRVDIRLEEAFNAWQAGDSGRARAAYEQVLATAPNSVDALLGLGAIALRENQPAAARGHYGRALELAPGNAVAMAAIFLIDAGEGDPAAAERLARLPNTNDPYVQFALGNHYAKEGRWADAQRAYLAASEGDPRNADYVFNLAVSLDRLGQRTAARDAYLRSLSLHRPVHRFDPSVVRARLATLDSP